MSAVTEADGHEMEAALLAAQNVIDGLSLVIAQQQVVMRQALEALCREVDPTGYWPASIKTMRKEAITALHGALGETT